MKITVTPENIKHVCALLQKAFKNGLREKLYYPTGAKQHNYRKGVGLRNNILTGAIKESGLSVFKIAVFETDFMFNKHFIRVKNQLTDAYDEHTYRAFLINCGDVVEFKGSTVNVRTAHPTRKHHKANQTIKSC